MRGFTFCSIVLNASFKQLKLQNAEILVYVSTYYLDYMIVCACVCDMICLECSNWVILHSTLYRSECLQWELAVIISYIIILYIAIIEDWCICTF